MTLITESELLSKGVEKCYMNAFSQEAFDEIRSVQAVTGNKIIEDECRAENGSDGTMISTMAEADPASRVDLNL